MLAAVASRSTRSNSPVEIERRHNQAALGAILAKIWPVDRTPKFQTLVNAIDREDRKARARQMLRKLGTGLKPRIQEE